MIDLGGVGHFINLLFFTCLPFLALMLICLSQEKEEDEYIQHLRSVTVFSIVVILFCASLITASSQMMLSFYGLGSVHYYLNWWCQYLSQMPVLAIIYIIVFKSLLFAQKIKSRRDE